MAQFPPSHKQKILGDSSRTPKCNLCIPGANPAPCLPFLLFLTLLTRVLDVIQPCFLVSWRGSAGKRLTQLQNDYLRIYTSRWICKPCLMLESPGDLMVWDFGSVCRHRCAGTSFCSSHPCSVLQKTTCMEVPCCRTVGLLFTLIHLSLLGSQIHCGSKGTLKRWLWRIIVDSL